MMKLPTVQTAYFPLKGGEDMVTAPLSVDPGALLLSLNYEPAVSHGYRRIDGFERVDGRPKASEASFWTLPFKNGASLISSGDLVESGAKHGIVLHVIINTGSFAGGDAAGTLVLYDVSGTFAEDDALTVSATPVATAAGSSAERDAPTDDLDFQWQVDAIEARRGRIQPLPGSGPVRGAWMFNGVHYAWRDNASGTAGIMYRSTSTGWEVCDLGIEIPFTTGTTGLLDGETVTGGTSGATGILAGYTVTDGSWAAGTAEGFLYIHSITGTFVAETLTTATGSVTGGTPVANTLSPGGRYDVVDANFKASASGKRLFAANGVNRAFQYDGHGIAFINTGMGALDKPTHVFPHKYHLFLSYVGGSVQHSGIGNPLSWDAATDGAGEIGVGSDVYSFKSLPGDVLAIFADGAAYLLHGTGAESWNLVLHSDEVGAVEWSVQSIGMPRYLTNRGLTGLDTTQAYGDFVMSTFSQQVQTYLLEMKDKVVSSTRSRNKDQYRLFFSDGTGLIAKFRSKKVEFTRIDYGKVVRCTASVDDADGNEVLLFGSDDGYVYQADSGRSFDGLPIVGLLRLPFGHLGSPQHMKRFHKAVLEMDGPPGTEITFSYECDYANPGVPRGQQRQLLVDGGGGIWGAATWNAFAWGSQVVGSAEGYLTGSGVNIGMYIRTESAHVAPHTLHGIILHYSIRSRKR